MKPAGTDLAGTIGAYYQAVRDVDLEAQIACFDRDGQARHPLAPPLRGHNALRRLYEFMLRGWEDVELAVDEVDRDGERWVVSSTVVARTRKGNTVRFPVTDTFLLGPDGDIVDLVSVWDADAVRSAM
jgi:hypothetical protein